MASAVALGRLLAACKMTKKDDVESFMMGRFQEKVGYEIWIGSDEETCCLRNNESREISLLHDIHVHAGAEESTGGGAHRTSSTDVEYSSARAPTQIIVLGRFREGAERWPAVAVVDHPNPPKK